MTKSLTARQTELAARRALTPVPLLKLTTYTDREARTGGVDRYFSDRPLQYDYGNTGTLRDFSPDLLEIDPLERLMIHIPAPDTPGDQVRRSASLRMRNGIDSAGTHLVTTLRTENLEGAIVELAQLLVDRNAGEPLQGDLSDLAGDEHLVWLRGEVVTVLDTTEAAFTLAIRSIVPSIDAPILNTPVENDPKDLGARLNQVYGEVKKVPCHGVKVGWATTISAPLTPTQTGFMSITDGTGFPSGTFDVYLSGEKITCDAATATTITMLTRGVDSTFGAAHASGEVVIEEVASAIYEIAGHECNAVDTVYVVNPFNQELVRVTPIRLGTIDLADTGAISGETITSLTFTEAELEDLFDELHTQSHVSTQPIHDGAHDHKTDITQKPTGGSDSLRDGDLATGVAVAASGSTTVTFPNPDGTRLGQTVHVQLGSGTYTGGTIKVKVGGTTINGAGYGPTTPIGLYSIETALTSGSISVGHDHTGGTAVVLEIWRSVEFLPQDPIVSRNTDVEVVGAQVGYGLRFFADVKGYEVPAGDSNYDASAGALIEKLPDIVRHYIVERGGGAHADCDATTWAAALTDLGANKHNFVESQIASAVLPVFEQILARLGWEGRTQVVQVETAARTVYKLLAANNPSAGEYDFDASLGPIENYGEANEEGVNLDTVFTRWRFGYDLNRTAPVLEVAFEAVLQCDPDQSDITGITTTEMANAEKAFGRHDHSGVFFVTIADENTAEDVAGYYVVESTRPKVIAHLDGVPWVEAYAVEIGDIHDAELPWWSAAKNLRITRYVKNWDTELIDLSGVEVP